MNSATGHTEANTKSVVEHILLFFRQLFVPPSSFSSRFRSSMSEFSITFLKAKKHEEHHGSRPPPQSAIHPLHCPPSQTKNQHLKREKEPNPRRAMGYQHHSPFGRSLRGPSHYVRQGQALSPAETSNATFSNATEA